METSKYSLYDNDTGAFVDKNIVSYRTREQQEAIHNRKVKDAAINSNNKGKRFNFQQSNNMKKVDKMLSMKYWGYFAVLSCYIDYHNMLKMDTYSKVPMTQQDMRGILKMSKQDTLKKFLNTLKDNKLLEERKVTVYGKERIAYYLSNDFIFKKSISSKRSVKHTSKVWTKCVKSIYEKGDLPPTDLGFIWRCIPYINMHNNFLTHNPEEQNPANDSPLSQSELAAILGVDKGTVTRKIKDTKFNNMSAFALVTVDGVKSIKLNPLVAYRKSDEPDSASYAEFFLNRNEK